MRQNPTHKDGMGGKQNSREVGEMGEQLAPAQEAEPLPSLSHLCSGQPAPARVAAGPAAKSAGWGSPTPPALTPPGSGPGSPICS